MCAGISADVLSVLCAGTRLIVLVSNKRSLSCDYVLGRTHPSAVYRACVGRSRSHDSPQLGCANALVAADAYVDRSLAYARRSTDPPTAAPAMTEPPIPPPCAIVPALLNRYARIALILLSIPAATATIAAPWPRFTCANRTCCRYRTLLSVEPLLTTSPPSYASSRSAAPSPDSSCKAVTEPVSRSTTLLLPIDLALRYLGVSRRISSHLLGSRLG